MQNWLPFSQKSQAKIPVNYNPFFTPNASGFYEKGGKVKVVQENDGRSLIDQNPLSKPANNDYPFAYSALMYGFGKGLRNPPDTVTLPKRRYTIQQVRELDASNNYKFIK